MVQEIDPTSFGASPLGTHQYWHSLYDRDHHHYTTQPSASTDTSSWSSDDEQAGEMWFGKSVMKRLCTYCQKTYPAETRYLDIGCGNGHLAARLLALHPMNEESKESLRVVGMDYAAPAIQLAQRVAERRGLRGISFQQDDILYPGQAWKWQCDVIVDKGTWDALSLLDDETLADIIGKSHSQRTVTDLIPLAHRYLAYCTLRMDANSPNRHLIITSCNWTREELQSLFGREAVSIISHPSFQFGGKQGSTVTTCVFQL